jgi:hypothetical protein
MEFSLVFSLCREMAWKSYLEWVSVGRLKMAPPLRDRKPLHDAPYILLKALKVRSLPFAPRDAQNMAAAVL